MSKIDNKCCNLSFHFYIRAYNLFNIKSAFPSNLQSANLNPQAEMLVQVLKLYYSHCVKDCFTFDNFTSSRTCKKSYLCSFDISSLFINVPLDETVEICADALYRGHLDCPPFPEDTFRELMLFATQGVEVSFNNQMYTKLDGAAMGSPPGSSISKHLC